MTISAAEIEKTRTAFAEIRNAAVIQANKLLSNGQLGVEVVDSLSANLRDFFAMQAGVFLVHEENPYVGISSQLTPADNVQDALGLNRVEPTKDGEVRASMRKIANPDPKNIRSNAQADISTIFGIEPVCLKVAQEQKDAGNLTEAQLEAVSNNLKVFFMTMAASATQKNAIVSSMEFSTNRFE